jgi:hypothetical protein
MTYLQSAGLTPEQMAVLHAEPRTECRGQRGTAGSLRAHWIRRCVPIGGNALRLRHPCRHTPVSSTPPSWVSGARRNGAIIGAIGGDLGATKISACPRRQPLLRATPLRRHQTHRQSRFFLGHHLRSAPGSGRVSTLLATRTDPECRTIVTRSLPMPPVPADGAGGRPMR